MLTSMSLLLLQGFQQSGPLVHTHLELAQDYLLYLKTGPDHWSRMRTIGSVVLLSPLAVVLPLRIKMTVQNNIGPKAHICRCIQKVL